MNDLLIYLLKVSAAIALVTLPYFLVLRNDASLVVKRIFLVTGIILSWIFPLLTIKKPNAVSSLDPVFLIDPVMPSEAKSITGIVDTGGTDAGMVLIFIYIAGIISFLVINIIALIRLSGKAGTDTPIKNVRYTTSDKVFTVYPRIFLPQKYTSLKEIDAILIHERAHIRQMHFVDLLISELSLALTWFNPFSWLISRMIKENHEHLADREVLSQGVKPAHYKTLLLNHAMGGEVFRLGHQFNHSLTKKRFNMMKKMKASKRGILKYILFVPAILAFTLMATAAGQQNRTIQGKVFLENAEVPATGATVLVTGTTKGTVVDRQGAFSIDVTGNPDLTVSFVGFENAKVTAKEIERKPVILVPTSYEVIPDRVKQDDLQEKKEKIRSQSEEAHVSTNYGAKTVSSSDIIENNTDEESFYIVEDLPRFPGGKKALGEYIDERLEYPEQASKQQIAGKVMVEFKVNTDGSLDDFRISQSSNEIFNDAALAVFRDMPRWSPGKQRGKAVSCKILVPVRFEPPQE